MPLRKQDFEIEIYPCSKISCRNGEGSRGPICHVQRGKCSRKSKKSSKGKKSKGSKGKKHSSKRSRGSKKKKSKGKKKRSSKKKDWRAMESTFQAQISGRNRARMQAIFDKYDPEGIHAGVDMPQVSLSFAEPSGKTTEVPVNVLVPRHKAK